MTTDQIAEQVRKEHDSAGILLLLADKQGNFSVACQADEAFRKVMPGVLRDMANTIEQDTRSEEAN